MTNTDITTISNIIFTLLPIIVFIFAIKLTNKSLTLLQAQNHQLKMLERKVNKKRC